MPASLAARVGVEMLGRSVRLQGRPNELDAVDVGRRQGHGQAVGACMARLP